MKTKELVRQLQEADPSGNEECCIGNLDIYEVRKLPAYYGGRLEVLERKSDCKSYDVIGAKFVASGVKIQITPWGIDDALFEDPDMPVDCSEVTDYEKNLVEKWREEGRNS